MQAAGTWWILTEHSSGAKRPMHSLAGFFTKPNLQGVWSTQNLISKPSAYYSGEQMNHKAFLMVLFRPGCSPNEGNISVLSSHWSYCGLRIAPIIQTLCPAEDFCFLRWLRFPSFLQGQAPAFHGHLRMQTWTKHCFFVSIIRWRAFLAIKPSCLVTATQGNCWGECWRDVTS